LGPVELSSGVDGAIAKGLSEIGGEFGFLRIFPGTDDHLVETAEKMKADLDPILAGPTFALPAGAGMNDGEVFELCVEGRGLGGLALEAERRDGRMDGQGGLDHAEILKGSVSEIAGVISNCVELAAPKWSKRPGGEMRGLMFSAGECEEPAAAFALGKFEGVIEFLRANCFEELGVLQNGFPGAVLLFGTGGGQDSLDGRAAGENTVRALPRDDPNFGAQLLPNSNDGGREQERIANMTQLDEEDLHSSQACMV
jgi:hypothetical protein